MNINNTALLDELRVTLNMIDRQIEAVKKDAWREVPVHLAPNPENFYLAKNADGEYRLIPLITARANCLLAMANLNGGASNR